MNGSAPGYCSSPLTSHLMILGVHLVIETQSPILTLPPNRVQDMRALAVAWATQFMFRLAVGALADGGRLYYLGGLTTWIACYACYQSRLALHSRR